MTASQIPDRGPLVAVVGPTAVGKTGLVLKLAEQLAAEIVNIDSMQVYRNMDIGTAKPSLLEQEQVRHHLIDIVNPDDEYNVSRFTEDAGLACSDIFARGRLPLLTGGTGLYLKAFQKGLFALDFGRSNEGRGRPEIKERLLEELAEKGRARLFDKLKEHDPVSALRIHPNDTSRLVRALEIFEMTGIPWSVHLSRQQDNPAKKAGRPVLKIGLSCDRELLYERINRRTEKMFEDGLLDETSKLLEMGYDRGMKSMQSLGYRHALCYLAGEWNLEDTIRLMARDTRHYAKRQQTWFGRDPEICWFEPSRDRDIVCAINEYLESIK